MEATPSPESLARLEAMSDEEYAGLLLAHLQSRLRREENPVLTACFRHPDLRFRTRRAFGRAMETIDKHDRRGQPWPERNRWRAGRDIAREEKELIQSLPEPVVDTDPPRRRALTRLAQEHPDDWARLLKEGGGPRKVSLRRLAEVSETHLRRYFQLFREEKSRQA